MNPFSELSSEEYKRLKETFASIAALIAGADGSVDEDEQQWAEKIAKIRSFSGHEQFFDLYKEVSEEISDDLRILITSLNGSMEDIQSALSERISLINPILAKMSPSDAHNLYKGFLSFAEHIAKASGGIFRFFAISRAEKKWINLSMITPIDEPSEEEE